MQAVMVVQPAWERVPKPSSARPLTRPPGQPADLYVSALDARGQVVLVSFSLGPLLALTRAELEVARWANAGHSNGVIARERRTATHTVARQMAEAMRKLGINARLQLATIPELSAWSPPGSYFQGPADALLSGEGREVEEQEAERIWRQIESGHFSALAGVDAGGMRHAVMERNAAKPVDWRILSPIHRDVLALVAGGFPQKAIAMKLGLAPSTVSGALQAAHKRLGFPSLGQLLRAYGSAGVSLS